MPSGRRGGGGGGGRKRRRGHQQQPRQRSAVDPSEFERQLEEQRRRQQEQQEQQEQAVASAAAAAVPRFLRGFEYDPARQRYFPRPRGRGWGRGSTASALQRRPRGGDQPQPQPRPPMPGLPALRGGIWARLLERERTGRGRAGALMGSLVQGSIDIERLQPQEWEHGPVADIDVLGCVLLLNRMRGGCRIE